MNLYNTVRVEDGPQIDGNGNVVLDSKGDPMKLDEDYKLGNRFGIYRGQMNGTLNLNYFSLPSGSNPNFMVVRANVAPFPVLSEGTGGSANRKRIFRRRRTHLAKTRRKKRRTRFHKSSHSNRER